MSDEQQHTPQHKKMLKKQELRQKEVPEMLNVFRKYAVPAAVVVLVICGIFLFDRYLKDRKVGKIHEADAALASARTPENLKAIVDEYASTPAAPFAMMGLARTKFNSGAYNEAVELYTRFLKKHGKHAMADQAELNLIACAEAQGQLEDAQQQYATFASEHGDSYLAPAARMNQARCLEVLGRSTEAKQAYEDVLAAYPDSEWAGMADQKLATLDHQPSM